MVALVNSLNFGTQNRTQNCSWQLLKFVVLLKSELFLLEKLFTKSSEYYKSTSRIMGFFKLALRITIPKCGARKEIHKRLASFPA